jgi:cytochrome P450
MNLAFDPFDPAQTQNLWPVLRELRRSAPVSRPRPGFAYVARYHDVKAVFRNTQDFSSREGFRGANVVLPLEESFLGELDPPLHTDLRVLMLQAFKPGLERRALPFTRELAERLLRDVIASGGGDLVERVSLRIPAAVTLHVLGIPSGDIAQVAAWGFELLHSTWPQTNRTERGVGLGGAFPELAGFLDEQIALRRRSADPPDDLITRMTRAEADGRQLADLQIRTLCANVLLASLSTSNLIGNLLWRFMRDPAFERALRADRELVPRAVEESLRLEPPVLFLFRTARREVALPGGTIRAGERVILGIASGNRDETVYPDPDAFRMQRWPGAAEQLTFGPGPHLCLGNALARMEARVALETAMDLLPERALQLDPPEHRVVHVPMFLEYGPDRLPARVSL